MKRSKIKRKNEKIIHKKIIIIGAGTAGLAAQRVLNRWTSDYLIVDPGPLGTTCARVGCMPSKALIEASKIYYQKEKMRKIGVRANLKMNQKAFFLHIRRLQKYFSEGMVNETLSIPTKNFIKKSSQFVDKNTIQVGTKKYRADFFIIATGSRAKVPSQWLHLKEDLWISDDVFKPNKVPKSLAVVGAGAIGLEIAQAYARIGTRVTVFGARRAFGGLKDKEAIQYAKKFLGKELKIIDHEVDDLKKVKKRFLIKYKNKNLYFEKVLVAIGRIPNNESLNLSITGLKLNEKGYPLYYDRQTTRVKNTNYFFVGDNSGYGPIQHEARWAGQMAALQVLEKLVGRPRRKVPLKITFTDPQIVMVGQNSEELKKAKIKFETKSFKFENQSRLLTQLNDKGMVKIHLDKKNKKL